MNDEYFNMKDLFKGNQSLWFKRNDFSIQRHFNPISSQYSQSVVAIEKDPTAVKKGDDYYFLEVNDPVDTVPLFYKKETELDNTVVFPFKTNPYKSDSKYLKTVSAWYFSQSSKSLPDYPFKNTEPKPQPEEPIEPGEPEETGEAEFIPEPENKPDTKPPPPDTKPPPPDTKPPPPDTKPQLQEKPTINPINKIIFNNQKGLELLKRVQNKNKSRRNRFKLYTLIS